eukprot:scaffold185516_cov51-Attheya_sp.AAC.2
MAYMMQIRTRLNVGRHKPYPPQIERVLRPTAATNYASYQLHATHRFRFGAVTFVIQRGR